MFKKFICLFVTVQLLTGAMPVAASFSSIDTSLTKLSKITDDSVFIAKASDEAMAFHKKKMTITSISFLEAAINVKPGNKEIKNELLSEISRFYYRIPDYDKALSIVDSLLTDSLNLKPRLLAKLYNLGGQCNFRMQQFMGSREYYRKAYAVIKRNNFKDIEDDVLSNLSTQAWMLGQLTETVKLGQEAIVICKANNDNNTLSRLLNTQGNINKDLGNFKEASKNYEECFDVAEKTGDREGMILSLTSRAMLERIAGRLGTAQMMQQKVVEIAEDYNVGHLMGGAYNNMASILWDKGMLDSARIYFNKALKLARESNDVQNLALTLSNLGFLETEMKDYQSSIVILNEAFRHAESLHDLRIMAEVSGGLYDNFKILNRYQDALKAHEQYQSLRDSLLNQEKLEEINQLKTNFAVQEKEHEMKLKAENAQALSNAEIRKQKYFRNASIFGSFCLLVLAIFIFQRYRERHHTNKILAEKNKTIEKSLADLKSTQSELLETERQREAQSIRVRIARDIHDEIGSGLTKITLLSDVARKKAASDEVANSLSKITSYSKNVSEALVEIVWAINPTHDTLSSLIGYMKSTASQMLEDTGINYRFNFPESVSQQNLHPDLKRNIFLVMKESLHNAIKYSEAKNIDVTFSVNGENFDLKISDDGKGFSFNGFESEGNGNGLVNMFNRMLQVKSALSIITSPGNGCTIQASGIIFDDFTKSI